MDMTERIAKIGETINKYILLDFSRVVVTLFRFWLRIRGFGVRVFFSNNANFSILQLSGESSFTLSCCSVCLSGIARAFALRLPSLP